VRKKENRIKASSLDETHNVLLKQQGCFSRAL